jgi:hypothetical protein
MKTVYQVNGMGFYVGETDADESPLEPGVFLIPAGCVETPPPEPPYGLWPRWNGSGWIMANMPRALAPVDPVEKLRAFLDNNPDVAELLLPNNGGANV